MPHWYLKLGPDHFFLYCFQLVKYQHLVIWRSVVQVASGGSENELNVNKITLQIQLLYSGYKVKKYWFCVSVRHPK